MASNLIPPQQPVMLSSESVLDILNMILAGAPLREVRTIIARLVEAQSDGMLCAIWFLDEEGKHFFCEAAPSLPQTYIDKVNGVEATPNGISCGGGLSQGAGVCHRHHDRPALGRLSGFGGILWSSLVLVLAADFQ